MLILVYYLWKKYDLKQCRKYFAPPPLRGARVLRERRKISWNFPLFPLVLLFPETKTLRHLFYCPRRTSSEMGLWNGLRLYDQSCIMMVYTLKNCPFFDRKPENLLHITVFLHENTVKIMKISILQWNYRKITVNRKIYGEIPGNSIARYSVKLL